MPTLNADVYRQPLFVFGDDPLFRRCLTGAGIAGILFLLVVLIAPVRQQTITSIEQVPERFAKLIIEKPKAKPAPPAPEVRSSQMEEIKAPEVETPAPAPPRPVEAPRARRLDAAKERAPDAGVQGRQRAQEATASVQKATQSIDRSLAALSTSLGNTAAETSRPGRRRARSVSSGRGGGEVADVNASVSTGGADLGGSAVQGSLVAIGSLSSGTEVGGGGGATADAVVGGGAAPGVYRSTASLLAVVQKYAAGIQYCYGNELKHDPSLAGKVVVSLTVSASGRVTQASIVHDTVRSQALSACALGQIREWRFPAIAEGVTTFQAPFVFTPPR